MQPDSQFTVRAVDPHCAEATELIRARAHDLSQRYDFADDGSGQFRPADAGVPRSDFVVSFVESRPVACGAFRLLGGDTCEIKRMFVQPDFRGRGYSRVVLMELERLASQAGYTAARLETGDLQPKAIGLYERTGYRRIANFGIYVDSVRSVCFEKELPLNELTIPAVTEPGA